MLHIKDLSLQRGKSPLFEHATFQVHPGQKVGLTGANGIGKSSFFAAILGQLQAEAGELKFPDTWVIASVAQETASTDRSAIDFVLDGDEEFRRLETALKQSEDRHEGEQLAHLHAEMEHIGGYQARSRAGQLMHGLGFSATDEELPYSTFSGGWRMRLSLAKALMCRSDLLLLDEPTNHLDLDAVLWLESWLKSYPGTLILISHDRDFLDSICTQILHIEHQQIKLYTGNYSAFEKLRAEFLANQQAEFHKQQREIQHIQTYIERFRAKATKAKQAQSRIKALERMTLIAPAHVDSPFHFSFKAPNRLPSPLVKIEEATVGYEDKNILSHIGLCVTPGDRIGLLGANGAGKSTLIRLFAGELKPKEGKLNYAKHLQLGYFAQHQLEQLHPEHTPVEHLLQLDPSATEQALRNYLGGFGFVGDKALEPVRPFSGGEKARLVLALIIYQKPNLLLLDEPTNHLDLEMRQALAQALQDYEGAVILVSHDRHLLRVTADQLLLVHDGEVSEFKGSLDDYAAWMNTQGKKQNDREANTSVHSAAARKERKQREAELRRRQQPLKKQLTALETRLKKAQAQQEAIETRLAEPDIYSEENKDTLKELLVQKSNIDKEISIIEDEWLEAQEALEQLTA